MPLHSMSPSAELATPRCDISCAAFNERPQLCEGMRVSTIPSSAGVVILSGCSSPELEVDPNSGCDGSQAMITPVQLQSSWECGQRGACLSAERPPQEATPALSLYGAMASCKVLKPWPLRFRGGDPTPAATHARKLSVRSSTNAHAKSVTTVPCQYRIDLVSTAASEPRCFCHTYIHKKGRPIAATTP